MLGQFERTTRAVTVGVAVIALSAAVAACGSSGSSSTSSSSSGTASGGASTTASTSACVATATKNVNAAMALVHAPTSYGTPVSAAKLKGKLIVAIPETLSIPDDVTWVNAVKAAGSAAGAQVRVLNGGGTPSSEIAALTEAQGLKPAVIMVDGIPLDTVANTIKALAAKNVPMVALYPGATATYPGMVKYVLNPNWPQVGRVEADTMLAATKCNLHAALFTTQTFPQINVLVSAEKAEIASLCPKCTTTTVNVPLTSLATGAGPDAVSALRSNPSINFISDSYDAMVGAMVPALQQAGLKVPIVGEAGTPQNTQYIKGGQQTDDLDPYSSEELGWMSVADAVRAVSGQPEGPWSAINEFLYNKATVAAAQAALNTTAYQAAFKQQWGQG
jgi:ABC-type sugar transport system substrate-binding protein